MMVAPNSPSARAQHRAIPAPSDGAISGRVTRRKVSQRPAPRVAAASSKRRSMARSPASTVMTRNGMATKASAMMAPAVVNGRVTECPSSHRADQPAAAEGQQQGHAADHRREHHRQVVEGPDQVAAGNSTRASRKASGDAEGHRHQHRPDRADQ